MRERYDEIRGKGVEVLALAPGSLEETGAFAAARGIPFPLLADPEHDVYRAYQVESRLLSLGQRPALYAIDRDGIVRYAYVGGSPDDRPVVDRILQEVRAAAGGGS